MKNLFLLALQEIHYMEFGLYYSNCFEFIFE